MSRRCTDNGNAEEAVCHSQKSVIPLWPDEEVRETTPAMLPPPTENLPSARIRSAGALGRILWLPRMRRRARPVSVQSEKVPPQRA